MDIKWTVQLPSEKDLDFWINHNLNVMLVGSHGIGKTMLVKGAFEKNNLNYRYFSAPTMDPWVDFIGVPKEQTDEKGQFLDLVRPKEFRDDQVEALFFDEYNRAPKKVQNAVMELIQFKSINGRKFPNLRFIWAAINDATDNDYNVEELDPAQMDRFHIIIKLPNKPSLAYFNNKFGRNGNIACVWWDKLPNNLKHFISPRRLDYVLEMYDRGGDITQLLPSDSGSNVLLQQLKEGLPYDKLKELLKLGDQEALKKWLNIAKNLSTIEPEIIERHLAACFGLLSQEKQSEWATRYNKVRKHISAHKDDFIDLLRNLSRSAQKDIKDWAKTSLPASKPAPASEPVPASESTFSYQTTILKDVEDFFAMPPRSIQTVKNLIISELRGKDWTVLHSPEKKSTIKIVPGKSNLYRIERDTSEPYIDTYNKKNLINNILSAEEYGEDILFAILRKINFYSCGMHDYTYAAIFKESKTKNALKDIILGYLDNHMSEYLTPLDFFLEFDHLYKMAKLADVI